MPRRLREARVRVLDRPELEEAFRQPEAPSHPEQRLAIRRHEVRPSLPAQHEPVQPQPPGQGVRDPVPPEPEFAPPQPHRITPGSVARPTGDAPGMKR